MGWSLFGREKAPAAGSELPKDAFVGLHLETDGAHDLWLVNKALLAFQDRARFPWRLSIVIEMEETQEGLPTKAEQQVLGGLSTALSALVKAGDNGVFVGSGSTRGIRTLLFQVHDAEIAHAALTKFVASPAATRAMEYRMERDPEWKEAEHYLRFVRANPA